MAQFTGRSDLSTEAMYGVHDLSSYPLFQGGFINFGYWDSVPASPTVTDRIQASRRLYEIVLDRLRIAPTDTLLEVGCGRGVGCVLALERYHPRTICGLDATAEQIARCVDAHRERLHDGRLQFVHGRADAMPFPDQQLSCVYSVEAAQHFPSLPAFFRETFRVLRPGGRLVVTTFFSQPGASFDAIARLIQTADAGIDFFPSIDTCLAQLQEAGFSDAQYESIGPHVWKGFDRWNTLVTPDEWGKNWWTAYQEGLVDYYVVEAQRPDGSGS